MSTTKTARNQKPATPRTLLPILVKLAEQGPSTAKQLDTDAIRMGRLIERELVKVTAQVESGKRGRPAHIYRVTKKGRDRARRAAAKA